MSPVHPGYGKMTCRGGYKVNRGNYQFTISRFWSLNRGMVARGRGCS